MAKIPDVTTSPIPGMVYRTYEEEEGDWRRRDHLGASQIGTLCERELWYSFRWAKKPDFGGRMLRLFKAGNDFEPRILKELRAIGITISGEQRMMLPAPHFGGSCDAIGEGFPESKVPHVIEFKTHNSKSFADLVAKGVKESKPRHYDQMMVYMGALKLTRAYYIAENKDTSELYAERIKFDRHTYVGLLEKANRIIYSPLPPTKIADNPARFECRFCGYKTMCHAQDKPEVNCRTCAFSTPTTDGRWECDVHEDTIPVDFAREGCSSHIFIPNLLNKEVLAAGNTRVEYIDGWVNENGNSKDYQP
jgi:hypothetical protein